MEKRRPHVAEEDAQPSFDVARKVHAWDFQTPFMEKVEAIGIEWLDFVGELKEEEGETQEAKERKQRVRDCYHTEMQDTFMLNCLGLLQAELIPKSGAYLNPKKVAPTMLWPRQPPNLEHKQPSVFTTLKRIWDGEEDDSIRIELRESSQRMLGPRGKGEFKQLPAVWFRHVALPRCCLAYKPLYIHTNAINV